MSFLGWFDCIFMITLVVLNIKFWKEDFSYKRTGCITILAFFVFSIFVIPVFSIFLDFKILKTLHPDKFDNSDAFNFLYLYFKFPFYWVLTIVQVAFLSFKIWIKGKNL